jgi:uncharacterized protein GlcG (DUF336 family)
MAATAHRTRRLILLVGISLGLALVTGSTGRTHPAAAQPVPLTVQRPSVTLGAAQALIEAAEAAAQQIGVPMVIVVVDESGVMKAFARMDGAFLLSVGIAYDKAYTAAAFGSPTHALYEVLKDQPAILASVGNIAHGTLIGGGYPIMAGGAVAGAIGVSGGSAEQDMQVAEAALAAVRP